MTAFLDLAQQHGSWAAAADHINNTYAARYQKWIDSGRHGHPTDPQFDDGFEQALAAQDTADARPCGPCWCETFEWNGLNRNFKTDPPSTCRCGHLEAEHAGGAR